MLRGLKISENVRLASELARCESGLTELRCELKYSIIVNDKDFKKLVISTQDKN